MRRYNDRNVQMNNGRTSAFLSTAIPASLLVLVLIASGLAFNRYLAEQDYVVYGRVPCDPRFSCFEVECAPADPRCGYEPTERFLLIVKEARGLPPAQSCGTNEDACSILACDDQTIEEYALADTTCVSGTE